MSNSTLKVFRIHLAQIREYFTLEDDMLRFCRDRQLSAGWDCAPPPPPHPTGGGGGGGRQSDISQCRAPTLFAPFIQEEGWEESWGREREGDGTLRGGVGEEERRGGGGEWIDGKNMWKKGEEEVK